MKRLFWLKLNNSNKSAVINVGTGLPVYYDNKLHAKEIRDTFNQGKNQCHVALGPDHRDYGVKRHPIRRGDVPRARRAR